MKAWCALPLGLCQLLTPLWTEPGLLLTRRSSRFTDTAELVRHGLTDSGFAEFRFPTGVVSQFVQFHGNSEETRRLTKLSLSECDLFARVLRTINSANQSIGGFRRRFEGLEDEGLYVEGQGLCKNMRTVAVDCRFARAPAVEPR